jgi:hypothetical protein
MGRARLRAGELIAALGAVAVVVLLLGVDWFSRPRAGNLSGWDALPTVRWVLLGAIALALVSALATVWARTPALPVAAGVAAAVGCLVAAALLAYRVLISTPGPGHDYGTLAGAYAGLACMLVVVGAGLWAVRDERPGRHSELEAELRPAPPPDAAAGARAPEAGARPGEARRQGGGQVPGPAA